MTGPNAPPRATLIHDWRWVLRYAWSVRWMTLAALLTGLECWFGFYTGEPPFGLPRGAFALAAFVTTVLAFAARFVAQRRGE